MNKELLIKAKELADRNYTIVISEDSTSNGDLIYSAKNPRLMGCMAEGDTPEEAISNLQDARVDYIYDSLIEGENIPEPDCSVQLTVGTSNCDNQKPSLQIIKSEYAHSDESPNINDESSLPSQFEIVMA